MNWKVTAINASLALLAIAGCGGSGGHTLTVTVVNQHSFAGDDCNQASRGGEFAGGEVQVKSNTGALQSTATLEAPGTPIHVRGPACQWTVALEGIKDSRVYTLTLTVPGVAQPLTQNVNKSELESNDWSYTLATYGP
jgi:hypothetical protein